MTSTTSLSEKTVDPDPFIQFSKWYHDHLTFGSTIPESMTLSTASREGIVSSRTVLLKDFNDSGFVFFTNYKSRKGSQILANPNVSLLFYWPESGRQVRIEGVAEKISQQDSEAYFSTRPRESQLSAWASEQSLVIPSRHHLEKRFDFYKDTFSSQPVEKPESWGGFRIIPVWFEFWQNGQFRLHDRISYSRKKSSWQIQRLAP